MAMQGTAARALWRGRIPVWAGLAAIVALSWLWLLRVNAGMSAMSGGMTHAPMGMAPRAPGIDLLLAFLMWTVMMVAMMVPTIQRAVSVFMTLALRRRPAQGVALPVALFVGGYVAAWALYAALAASAQIGLQRAALLSPMLQSTSLLLSAAVLAAAGIFQFTALKEACLAKCRAPLGFFLAEWRDGGAGATLLGLRYGGYCVLCCWALMAVMFVVGAMNLLWMAALALFLIGEKMLPARWPLNEVSGALLLAWSGWTAFGLWS